VLDFLKSSSRTRASPPVLLDIGDNTHDDLPAAEEEAPPSCIVSCFLFYVYVHFCVRIYCYIVKTNCLETLSPL